MSFFWIHLITLTTAMVLGDSLISTRLPYHGDQLQRYTRSPSKGNERQTFGQAGQEASEDDRADNGVIGPLTCSASCVCIGICTKVPHCLKGCKQVVLDVCKFLINC